MAGEDAKVIIVLTEVYATQRYWVSNIMLFSLFVLWCYEFSSILVYVYYNQFSDQTWRLHAVIQQSHPSDQNVYKCLYNKTSRDYKDKMQTINAYMG